MLDRLRVRYYATRRRVRRVQRHEIREGRRWVEHTSNLVHLSVLVFVPLLVGVVTWLSGAIPRLSFLLFPPLASGTYTLFSDPQGPHSSPWKFVGGLTLGALCGWAALEFSSLFIYDVPPSQFHAAPIAAALGVLLTAVGTWALDVEEPSAFSTALLVLITTTTSFDYVITVVLSSAIVAGVFVAWRELIYEQRASYLYQSVNSDDHVLVPIRAEHPELTALFGARLAAAHNTGRVVLLDIVDQATIGDAVERMDTVEDAETPAAGARDSKRWYAETTPHADGTATGGSAVTLEGTGAPNPNTAETPALGPIARELTDQRLARLAEIERRVTDELDVSCESTITATSTSAAETVLGVARETNCDLIVTPYEEGRHGLSDYVRQLFADDIDTVVFRSTRGRSHWERVLVPVHRAGDIAHSMLDFARRLAGEDGWVSVCSCISSEKERRTAERMLADLVETVGCSCETHVAQANIEEYLAERAPAYDLVVMGASTDRSAASRLLSPPTFQRVRDIDCDVAIVHEG